MLIFIGYFVYQLVNVQAKGSLRYDRVTTALTFDLEVRLNLSRQSNVLNFARTLKAAQDDCVLLLVQY